MSATAQLRVVEAEHVGIVEGDANPLLPEATYRAVFVRSTTMVVRMFGSAPKVFLDFRIVDPGEAFGVIVSRLYRVKALSSKPGRNGTFRLGKRSELYLALSRLTSARLRPDRISVKELLRGRVLLVRVRTVKTDYQHARCPRRCSIPWWTAWPAPTPNDERHRVLCSVFSVLCSTFCVPCSA